MKFLVFLTTHLRSISIRVRTLIIPNYQARKWAGERGNPTSLTYLDEIDSDRNYILWNVLDRFELDTVVEIGSSLGSKLIGYAKANPKLKIVGLDINKQAIEKGNELAASLGLANLEFKNFNLLSDNLQDLNLNLNKSVIFSWATLIYIHPRDINSVLRKILEVNPLGFVFIEQHSAQLSPVLKTGKLISGGPNFIRDYSFLLKKLGALEEYNLYHQGVNREVWSPGGGQGFMFIGERNHSH